MSIQMEKKKSKKVYFKDIFEYQSFKESLLKNNFNLSCLKTCNLRNMKVTDNKPSRRMTKVSFHTDFVPRSTISSGKHNKISYMQSSFNQKSSRQIAVNPFRRNSIHSSRLRFNDDQMQKKINMYINPYNKSIVAHEHVDFDAENRTEEMVTSCEQAETNWGKIKNFILQSDSKHFKENCKLIKGELCNKKSFKIAKVKSKRKKNNCQNPNFSSIVKNILGKKNPIALIKKSSTKLPAKKANNCRLTVASLEPQVATPKMMRTISMRPSQGPTPDKNEPKNADIDWIFTPVVTKHIPRKRNKIDS